MDIMFHTWGWLKRKQKIKTAPKPVMVNLGCGLTVAQGWINIDGSFNALIAGFPVSIIKKFYSKSGSRNFFTQEQYIDILKNHHFVYHKLEYGIPFHNETVDIVFSSHLLEHLFREDAEKVLQEAYRVLKPGGIIRTVLPDLEYAIKVYQSGDKEKALRYFFRDKNSGYLQRHQYMYDYEMFKDLLEKNGFRNVTRCAYQEGATPNLDILDTRPEESFYVEAIK